MQNTRIVRQMFLLPVLIFALLFIPLAGANAAPQEADSPPPQPPGLADPEELEAFADRFFQKREIMEKQIPGAVLVIVKDGDVWLAKGYGYADLENRVPVDPENTLFRLASITKVFTAVSVMQQVEQGKIALDQDVRRYLGDIRLENKTNTPLTVEHLLTHSTGFDRVDSPPGGLIKFDPEEADSLEDYVRTYLPAVVREPGEAYIYDNNASMLQGYIVQRVTGMPFSQYLEEHLFKPLGMKHTSLLVTEENLGRLATAYVDQNVPLPFYSINPVENPQGGIVSTGSDMARFMLALLNGGTLDGAQILKPETIRTMQTPKRSIHPKVPQIGYGFEFAFHEAFNGQSVVGKGGDLPGYSSWMYLLPEQNIGIFIAYNKTENDDMTDARELFFKAFMNHYFPAAGQPADYPSEAEQLKRFEGLYRDLRVGYVVTRVYVGDDGQLTAENLLGRQKLRQIDPLLFLDEEGAPVAFKEGESGEIRYMYSRANIVSWSEKMPEPAPFRDVDAQHPYAAYINYLHQLQIVQGNADGTFAPDQPITRAEFIAWVLDWLGIPGYNSPAPWFRDIAGHPLAGEIQAATDALLVTGTPSGDFHPDQVITRQEAAVIIWRLMAQLGFQPMEAPVTDETDEWAAEAVMNMVAYELYGPEVQPDASGAVDYQSKRPMTRQEAAALIYQISMFF